MLKEQFKNIGAQIGEILRTPSLGQNLLVLIKKSVDVEIKNDLNGDSYTGFLFVG